MFILGACLFTPGLLQAKIEQKNYRFEPMTGNFHSLIPVSHVSPE